MYWQTSQCFLHIESTEACEQHAASNCYELQQGGKALVEHLKSIRELNKHSIQDMVDLLRSEKETAVSKKQSLDGEISRLQRQLEMMETEYKLVDKTRVKALQVLQHLFPTLPKLFPWT